MKKLLTAVTCFACVLLLGGCGKSITQKEAQDIALKDAGLKENEATFTSEKSDEDSYEFEFHTDEKTYKYEIDKDGSIAEKETNTYLKPNTTNQNTPSNTTGETPTTPALTQEEALVKAYAHFNVSADTLSNVVVKQENDDGINVFDIEFDSGGKEYSCEINTATGEIVSSDIDHQ